MKALSISLIFGLFVVSSNVHSFSGSYYLQVCETSLEKIDTNSTYIQGLESGFCYGSISTAYGVLNIQGGRLSKYKSCLPDEALPNDQLIRIVLKYLKDHPEDLHKDGLVSVFLALMTAFNCK